MLSMFMNINEESILKIGAQFFKESGNNLGQNVYKNKGFALGRTVEIPEFLGDNNLKVNIWIDDESGNYLSKENIKAYEKFIESYNEYDNMVRQTILNTFYRNKKYIVETMKSMYGSGYCNAVDTYNFTADNIDMICELSCIIIEHGNLSVVVGGYWDDLIEVPIIYNSPFNEVTTFRNIEVDTNMAVIKTKGKVRSFLGENNKEFNVWLINTYEIEPIQEYRYRDFQKRHSYYSNLVAESLVKYYKLNILNIKDSILDKDRSKFIDQYNINKKNIFNLCTLDKLEISSDGTTIIVVTTEWGEEISIKLWDKDIPLTNYFALPMCGNKFGPVN